MTNTLLQIGYGIFLGAVVVGVAHGLLQKQDDTSVATNDDLYYQKFFVDIIDHNNNLCIIEDSPIGDVTIRVVYEAGNKREDDTVGTWSASDNTITLWGDGMNISTVAHEVSHAVETLIVRHGITDWHVRAGLQGYLTNCVAVITLNDNI